MSNVTITSDGTADGTFVKIDDCFLKGLVKIEFDDIVPMGEIRAKLTVNVASLQIAMKDAEIVTDNEEVLIAIKGVLNHE